MYSSNQEDGSVQPASLQNSDSAINVVAPPFGQRVSPSLGGRGARAAKKLVRAPGAERAPLRTQTLRLRVPRADGSVIAFYSDEHAFDIAKARSLARALFDSPDDQAKLQAALSALDRMEARTRAAEGAPAAAGVGDSRWESDLLRVLRG